ncbi:MAG: DUF2561 family protein [Pedosphaera sp.]|nr:DUF2561 family protein [Pedosphaera sp.]
MKIIRTIAAIFLLLIGVGFFATEAQACAACFGNSDSQLAKGMNAGIMVLLIFVSGVLLLIGAFSIYLWKREVAHQSELSRQSTVEALTL